VLLFGQRTIGTNSMNDSGEQSHTSDSGATSRLRLAPDLDPMALQAEFLKGLRLHVPNVLENDSADAIYMCLNEQQQWNLACNVDDRHIDMDATAVEGWTPEERRKLDTLIYYETGKGIRYTYKTIPIYDMYHNGILPGHFLHRVHEFINSPEFIGFIRTISADDSISFSDGMATCFEQGHFLTTHDDDVATRRAAFVLNLTPDWHQDWGGALKFFDEEGNTELALIPTYNALNIFRIPMCHSVEFVTPLAKAARLSIVGFLRSGEDPKSRDSPLPDTD